MSLPLSGYKVTFVSESALMTNSRYLRLDRAIRSAGGVTDAIILGAADPSGPGTPMTGLHQYIPRRAHKPGRIASFLSYRAQKKQVFAALRDSAPDIVHAMDYLALDVSARIAPGIGAKLVFDAGTTFSDLAHATPATRAYEEKVLRRGQSALAAVLVADEVLQADYAEKLQPTPEIKVVTNTPDKIYTGDYDGRLHKQAGVRDNTKILLYYGAFQDRRGLRMLVQSAVDLPRPYALVLMGWGRLAPELQAAASAVNETVGRKVVTLLKPVAQSERQKWICGAFMGLVPYKETGRQEPFCTPKKLHEYAFAGVPVIVSDLERLSGIVNSTGIGLVVKAPVTAIGIAERLKFMPEKTYASMKSACTAFAEAEQKRTGLDDLPEFYAAIVSDHPRRDLSAEKAPETLASRESNEGRSVMSTFQDAKDLYYAKDYEAALPGLTGSSEAGITEADFYLGVMYQLGLSVDVDYRKAAEHYRAAASGGHRDSAFNLGILYQAGLLGADKIAKALDWHEKAASLGHPKAEDKILEVLDITDPERAGLLRVQRSRSRPRSVWDKLTARR